MGRNQTSSEEYFAGKWIFIAFHVQVTQKNCILYKLTPKGKEAELQ